MREMLYDLLGRARRRSFNRNARMSSFKWVKQVLFIFIVVLDTHVLKKKSKSYQLKKKLQVFVEMLKS